MTYARRREHSDQFIPAIKRILVDVFLETASPEEDCCEATDLVFRMRASTVACRVRKSKLVHPTHPFRDENAHEVTIRSWLPSGRETELAKILKGKPDLYFYGFGDHDTRAIDRWVVYDLTLFRIAWRNKLLRHVDRDTGAERFVAFDLRQLPSLIVQASPDWLNRLERLAS